MSIERSGGALGLRRRFTLGASSHDDGEPPEEGFGAQPRSANLSRLFRNRLSVVGFVTLGLVVLAVLIGPLIWTASPTDQDLANAIATPSGTHPLGTDTNGRDVLARVLHGGRLSLAIAFCAVAGAAFLGTLIGLMCGFLRGPVDMVVMRVMDVMMAFPSLVLAISIVAIAGPTPVNVAIAVGVPSIPFFARLTRSVVISVREREYVLAARAAGVRGWRIMTRHVLRNSLSAVIVATALSFGFALLEVATLGFLGLGVQPPQAEWGSMLVDANQYLLSSPTVLIVPGLVIGITAIAGNLVGDALNDALDPST
jgi:peptide/nickel transport system permease protein